MSLDSDEEKEITNLCRHNNPEEILESLEGFYSRRLQRPGADPLDLDVSRILKQAIEVIKKQRLVRKGEFLEDMKKLHESPAFKEIFNAGKPKSLENSKVTP